MGVNLSIAPQDYFILDGVDSRDFGVFLFRKETLTSPARVYQRIAVPGRNGDVLIDEGKYENVEHSYGLIILDKPYDNVTAFKNFLLSRAGGYCRLEDTFDTEEFYMAHIAGSIIPEMVTDTDKVVCELSFDRKPQRYLKLGEETKTFVNEQQYSTTIGTLENPTYNESSPLISVWGNGEFYIRTPDMWMFDCVVNVRDNLTGEPIIIDCEEQDAYIVLDGIKYNANQNIVLLNGNFPHMFVGTNQIVASGIDKISIRPGWWRL